MQVSQETVPPTVAPEEAPKPHKQPSTEKELPILSFKDIFRTDVQVRARIFRRKTVRREKKC